jgi:outer membrane protein assembly factor BamA
LRPLKHRPQQPRLPNHALPLGRSAGDDRADCRAGEIISRPRPLTSAEQAQVLAQIRTHEGDKFEPTTVEGDYQRVYGLRKFSNVEARFEPTATGVIVVFELTQQNLIKEIRFKGNEHSTHKLSRTWPISNLGKPSIPSASPWPRKRFRKPIKGKNFPHSRVDIDMDQLSKTGIVTFDIVEGPRVKVRNVVIRGNKSFTDNKIKDQIKTKPSFLFFNSGELSTLIRSITMWQHSPVLRKPRLFRCARGPQDRRLAGSEGSAGRIRDR